jgi:DNA ligase (NAD+)
MIELINIPQMCPICGEKTEIHISESGIEELYCDNPNCEGKIINKLEHFCGKKGLDIKGISKATLEKLLDWGWISSCEDIFNLKNYRNDWIKKPGFGAKSVDNVLNAIEASRECELSAFIAALGIPLVGSTASKDIANHFKTWDNFIAAVNKKFDFSLLPNFGGEMNYSINHFDYIEAINIVENYIKFNEPVEEISENNLNGAVFVITGKLIHFKNRDELKNKIEASGGKVTGSVSKNTSYLINNDAESLSSKNKTAKDLNIPIITEKNFISMFNIT